MEEIRLLHMQPTLAIIAEELNRMGLDCRQNGGDGRRFAGVRLFAPGQNTQEDQLYLLRPADAARFPAEERACICAAPVRGRAGSIRCEAPEAQVLDAVLSLFDHFRAQEAQMDEVVYRNGDLRELAEVGAQMLDNPICIHDDWFVMIARSSELGEVMPPDYIMSSNKEFIPRIIVDDFKNDTDYLETYAHRSARVWKATADTPECLYANLWEGSAYRGRLLVVRYHRAFTAADCMLADVLAQRALMLVNRKRLGTDREIRSMDDIVYDLVLGRREDPQEVGQLLAMLGWNRQDSMVCVRLRSQMPEISAMMEHALHSDMFRAFPGGYILYSDREQCAVLNVTQNPMGLPELRRALAPLCRDYGLYAGISSPVPGIRELGAAYYEARRALERAFELRSEKWIIAFSECALDVLLQSVQPPLTPGHLVSPQLRALLDYDAKNGTEYFKTLRCYLLCERDIPRASEALIIHRTTLIYRLKKIASIISVDLEDPRQRLYLTLSLEILAGEAR